MQRKFSFNFLFFLLFFSLSPFLPFEIVLGQNGTSTPACTPGEVGGDCGICGVLVCTCDAQGNCTFVCHESPKPPTTKTENWTGYKCQSTTCGGSVEIANCKTDYSRDCWCAGGGNWECSEWKCEKTDCDNVRTLKTCEYWQVCAIEGAILKCDDQSCWMEKNEWTALVDGNCEKSFKCKKENFSACQPTFFQQKPLFCQCWGQCLDPVVNAHYYDGQKELPWKEDCTKFPKKWQREECEILNREGIKLPVKFGWDMPGRWQDYWASLTDSSTDESVWSLKLVLNRSEIFLTHDQLLNVTKFKNPKDQKETKYEALNRLLTSACPSNELLSFLRNWDSNPLLDFNKLDQACRDKQRLNQILYFIYFVEGGDPVGKPGGGPGIFTYSISQDKRRGPCSLTSGLNYEWKVKLCCSKDRENCGPPDPIRNSKMTPKQAEKWNFSTHPAPEPVGILEAHINKWWRGTKKQCFLFWCWNVEVDEFKANAVRWIDTDWNGPNTIILKEGNFIEFEWCKTGQIEGVRAFYKGKILLKERLPGEEKIEQRKKEGPPECENPGLPCFCEDPNIDVKIRACLCDKFKKPAGFNFEKDCKSIFLENFDLCHPNLVKNSEKPRLVWNVTEMFGKTIEEIRNEINKGNEDEIRWEIKKKMEENCSALPIEDFEGVRLAKNEKIDIIEDPYYPLKYGVNILNATTGEQTLINPPVILTGGGINHPPSEVNNLGGIWGWDFQLLYFSLHNKFSWQPSLVISTNKPKDHGMEFIYGQSWNFLLTKKPIMKWSIKEERLVPAEKITEIKFFSPDVEVSTTTVNSSVVPVIYRLQTGVIPYVHRTFSNYLEFFDENGKPISMPKDFLILRERRGKTEEVTKIHQFWPCLKKQDGDESLTKDNPNYYRLDREFLLRVTPCFDEWGEICLPEMGLNQKLKTTGAKPTFNEIGSGPPPPERVKVPLYLNWDSVPGAVSFLVEINGPRSKVKRITIRDSHFWLESQGDGWYRWNIRSCADKCGFPFPSKEELLQCGTSSDEKVFYACEMNPPQKFSPQPGEEFFPYELTSFYWDIVDCFGRVPFYQFKLEYITPTNCESLKRELREKCREIQNSEQCKNLSMSKTIIPVTTITTNSFVLPSPLECLGTYAWWIRACLDEECKGGGNWSNPLDFRVVLEKVSKGKSGGGGFGTCKNIIHCTNCQLSDIPKIIANILNCLLWTISPIAMTLLLLYTGIGIYFSLGSRETIERAKYLWKAVGIGWLIMLFSLTIVKLIGKIFRLPGW